MKTITEAIEMRSYELLGNLDDELDALESFVVDYDGSTYICDAISEIADSYIPIYNYDVWKNASNIQEHIEEAIASGIAPTEGNNLDLIRIFQAGYYQYYTQSLYNNLDTLAFNYIADKVNEAINNLNKETQESIDLEAVESSIEDETYGYDNNNTYDDLDEFTKEVINDINEGSYPL
jgi:hypothetical protein